MKGDQLLEERIGNEVGGDRLSRDVAILQESKTEVVSHPIDISLCGCRPLEWLYLPSVGNS